MNLTWKDIRFNWVRFVIAVCGVGAMVCATIGLIGMYRGLLHEALLLVLAGDTDLWVVQANTFGPIIEMSRVPGNLDRRIEGVPGVKNVHRFVHYNRQFLVGDRRRGIAVTGLDYPRDNGSWLPLIAGRHLSRGHYDAIADTSLGFVVGDVIRLGPDDYSIVGITRGQVDPAGDGLLFMSVPDAITINQYSPSEAVILGRRLHPGNEIRTPPPVAAVQVSLLPGADVATVRRIIEKWGDVKVLDRAEQVDVVVNGRLYKLRVQILAFVIAMLAITGVVVALAVYTSVLEKVHPIAILKLMGAENGIIVWMIVQNSMLIGAFGAALALALSVLIFPYFPRSVAVLPQDVIPLFAALLFVCALASWLGVARAMRVRAQEVLA